MAYAVARGVLRDSGMAEDATQEAYLRAFRRLQDLEEAAGFVTWLRRIVITVALNMRRARRVTLLQLDDIPEAPVLDEAETSWSELQRRRLAGSLLILSTDERQLCDADTTAAGALPDWLETPECPNRSCGNVCNAFAISCARR
jgi:RNA polymerase sigma factor (sigma-70 family)